MKALVVYESMFGNTRTIAKAVAEGLSCGLETDLVEVGAASSVLNDEIDLLVVGGPTHAFGMSRPGTRKSAAQQAMEGAVSKGIGQREWLDALERGPKSVAAAVFDTRINKPHWLVGSAARAVEKRLRRLGFRLVASSQSFYVEGTPGPLLDGEEDRARRWGEELASEFSAREAERQVS